MPTRTFIVEILLRARDEISGAMNKATQSVQNLTKAQQDHGKVADANVEKIKGEVTELQKLHAAHIREKSDLDASAASRRRDAAGIREHADALSRDLNASREAQRAHIAEADSLAQAAKARQEATGKVDAQSRSYLAQSRAQRQLATEQGRLIQGIQREVGSIENRAKAYDAEARTIESRSRSVSRSVASTTERIVRLRRDADHLQGAGRGIRGFFSDLRQGARDSEQNLARLSASFKGFAIALVIKYAQALISTLTGLAGTLISVAGAAIQAGAALGGAFVAGAAQAIPVIGALAAVAARLGAVFQALRAQQQNRLTAGRSEAQAAEQQRNAINQVRSAEEALANAHRSATEAQRTLTSARRDARRELEDLILAEQRAQLQAEGANLSLEQAQARLRQAIATGASGDIGQAQLDVGEARLGRREATRGSQRATQDLRLREQQGSEGLRQAELALASARRQEADAARSLAEARHDAATQADSEASSVDRLQEMLKQLSPAELNLFSVITRLQATYRREVRPITDIIINAFARAAERARQLLNDPTIIAGFRRIAGAIAGAIDSITKAGSSGGSRSFFAFITTEAAKNIPIVTRIIERFFGAFKNLARAAAPALHDLLVVIEGYAGAAERASTPTKHLVDFFRTGVVYFKAWVDLGLAAVDLILALTGASAGEGLKTIEGATKALHEQADSIRENRREVAKFFADAREVTADVVSVLATLVKEVIRAFSPENVHAFADFLNQVVIPALGTTIEAMGHLTTAAHFLLSQPIIRDIAQWAATFILLAKGLLIIRGAMIGLQLIVTSFLVTFGIIPALILGVVVAILLLDRRLHFLAPTFKFIGNIAKIAFRAIVEAAKDVASFFSDSWQHGLIRVLRYPLELFYRYVLRFSPFILLVTHARDVIDFFKGDTWSKIFDVISLPFRIARAVIKSQFNLVRAAVTVLLDLIRGDVGGAKDSIVGVFKGIATGIKNVWESVFKTIYNTVADVINAIISGVNAAIGAFNKLPGPNIGKVDFHVKSFDQASTLGKAKRGEETTTYAGPHAMGGMIQKARGGRLAMVGEGGYDEVVLTTDPRHAGRQRNLLSEYLRQAPHVIGGFDKGGYVQGAMPPHGHNILELIHKAFNRGFSVTSALRPGGKTYHGPPGQAADFGDSVNNMASVWNWLYPQKRVFAELFGPTSVSRGLGYHFGVPSNQEGSRLQEDHEDHVHVAFLDGVLGTARALKRLGASGVGAVTDVVPRMPTALARPIREQIGRDPRGRTGSFATGALGSVYRQATRAILDIRRRVSGAAEVSGGLPGTTYDGPLDRSFPSHHLSNAAGHVRLSARQVAQVASGAGLPTSIFVPIARGESSFYPGVIGDDPNGFSHGRGLFQITPEVQSAATRAIFRRLGDYFNPVDNAKMAKYLYDHAPSKTPNTQGFPWFGTQFLNVGGPVAGRGAVSAVLHGGEHVWTQGEVERAGGHGVMRAMRRMLGGGRQGGPTSYQDGGATVAGIHLASRPPSREIKSTIEAISEIIDVLVKALPKSKKLAARIRRALERVTEEGGPLDRLAKEIEAIGVRGGLALQRAQFRVGSGGPVRTALTDVEIGQRELGTLGRQRAGLQAEQGGVGAALQAARRSLTQARKSGNKKAEGQALGEIKKFKQLQDDVSSQLVQNAQDMVEKQEAIQQSMLDAVNNGAQRQLDAVDRQERVATAFGQAVDPSSIVQQRIGVMQQQVAALQPVLAAANRSGNSQLAQQVRDQIDDLNASIVEATAAFFQARIEQINDAATRGGRQADLLQRLAQLGGRTNFGLVQQSLQTRGGSLQTQRAQLAGVLGEMLRAGFGGKPITDLTDQIAELDVSIAENTQAIQDNTDSARAQQISDIGTQAGFAGTVTGGAQSFFQSLSDITGQNFTSIIGQILGTQTSALTQERGGLIGVLSDLLGFNPGERQGLQGMSPQELVTFLLSITSGPAFDSIMSRLNPTQQAQFRDLVGALLTNANAVNSNTQAIEENTAKTNFQSFSSSAWRLFREAIFTGSGGLLPQYASLIPHAQSGGWISREGVVYAHRGEEIRPAGAGGEVFAPQINVVEQVETADPEVISNRIYFRYKTRPRTG